MAVSLVRTFRSLASEKYNKVDILIYLVLLISLGAVSSNFLIFIIFGIISSGYYSIASNNEIHNRPQILPSASDLGNVFIQGVKLFFGSVIIFMATAFVPIMFFASASTMITSSANNGGIDRFTISIICIILTILFLLFIPYLYIIPLFLVYLRTLKFSDLFNFKHAIAFRNSRKKRYKSYFSNIIILSIILYILSFAILYLIIFVFADEIPDNFMSYENIKKMMLIFPIYSIMLGLVLPNLNGQVAMNLKKKPKLQDKPQTTSSEG